MAKKKRTSESVKWSVIQKKLIEAGVKNLKEFGYPSVTSENIFTDYVYSKFFKSMLEDDSNTGKGFDGEIKGLLKEIK